MGHIGMMEIGNIGGEMCTGEGIGYFITETQHIQYDSGILYYSTYQISLY